MGYFRSIQQIKEIHTLRVLDLTADLIRLNPANYTAWQYRRLCLLYHYNHSSSSSSFNIDNELIFIQEIADIFGAKNYQLWAHRREIIRWILENGTKLYEDDLSTSSSSSLSNTKKTEIFNQWKQELGYNELLFTLRYLIKDIKNYHVWGQRQWIIQTFNIWDQIINTNTVNINEFEFIENLLIGNDDSDIRNNSVWNYRWFIFTRGKGHINMQTVPTIIDAINLSSSSSNTPTTSNNSYIITEELLSKEIQFVLTCLNIVQKNESAWSYLRALVRLPYISSNTNQPNINISLHNWLIIYKFCVKCQNFSYPGINIYANEWLAEYYEEELYYYGNNKNITKNEISSSSSTTSSSAISLSSMNCITTSFNECYQKIIELYTNNYNHDIIRKKYWLYRNQIIQQYYTNIIQKDTHP